MPLFRLISRPRMYRVVARLDETTPDAFVAALFTEMFGVEQASALNLVEQMRENGQVFLGLYSKEIAETKASLSNDVCRHEGYGMTFDIKV